MSNSILRNKSSLLYNNFLRDRNRKIKLKLVLKRFYSDAYFDGYAAERGCIKSAQNEILCEKIGQGKP